MPSWHLKAALQGFMSFLPRPQQWNYMFQRYVSKGLRLRPAYFEGKLAVCSQHLEAYTSQHEALPQRVLELGTGWLPIVPIGLSLTGVGTTITVDIEPLFRRHLVRETLAFFKRYADAGTLADHLPQVATDRVATLNDTLDNFDTLPLDAVWDQLGIQTIVQDLRTVRVPPADLIVSTSTLEHIPPDMLDDIFAAFANLLNAERGLMSHLIDLSDHYAHFDARITPYNFLQYSEAQWRKYDNALLYQNRLRVSDYRSLHQRHGFTLLLEENHRSQDTLPPTLAPDATFRSYPEHELLVTLSQMVSRF